MMRAGEKYEITLMLEGCLSECRKCPFLELGKTLGGTYTKRNPIRDEYAINGKPDGVLNKKVNVEDEFLVYLPEGRCGHKMIIDGRLVDAIDVSESLRQLAKNEGYTVDILNVEQVKINK